MDSFGEDLRSVVKPERNRLVCACWDCSSVSAKLLDYVIRFHVQTHLGRADFGKQKHGPRGQLNQFATDHGL